MSVLCSHIAFGQQPAEENNANYDGISFRVILAPLEKANEYTWFHVVITNNSKDTISYLGYSLSNPIWKQQFINEKSAWEDISGGLYCGTGLYFHQLLPGEKATISISRISPTKDVRIGLDYRINKVDYTVWTDKFTYLPEK